MQESSICRDGSLHLLSYDGCEVSRYDVLEDDAEVITEAQCIELGQHEMREQLLAPSSYNVFHSIGLECLDQEAEQHTGSTCRTDDTRYVGAHGIHEQVVGGVGLLTLVV